jgi:hypothetical protein
MIVPKKGQRVTYWKDGTRHRWEGTVTEVFLDGDRNSSASRFSVRWDALNEDTHYGISAYSPWSNGMGYYAGYISPSSEAREHWKRWFIAGENGGKIHEYGGDEAGAKEMASKMAMKSNSGQAYVLYKAVKRFQRVEPVREEDI